MGVKMNLTIITKNHAADLKIRFLTKSISKPNGRARPCRKELINQKFLRLFNGFVITTRRMKVFM